MAPLWVSSVRRRPVAAISILLITLLTVLAGAVGPILLRAVEQSALQESLASAPAGSNDVVLTSNTGSSLAAEDALSGVAALSSTISGPLFGPPVRIAETETVNWRASARARDRQRVRAVADPDGCLRFPIVSGRCPQTEKEVAVPIADLTAHLTNVGATIIVGFFDNPFTVVGGYDPARSTALLIATTDPASTVANGTSGNDLIMSLGGVSSLNISTRVSVRVPLVADRLRMDQLPQVDATIAATRAAILNQSQLMTLTTGLTDRLAAVAADRQAAEALVLVVVVQALVVAWFSAVVVISIVSRARAREWALGRLRGVRRLPWLVSVFAEPLVLLVLGSAGGLALATLLARAATHRWLRAGTTIEPFRGPVLVAAGLAVGGLVAALVASSVRSARAPLASLLSEGAEPARVGRFVLIGEVLIVALAGASVYQLHAASDLSASNARLALAAPALLAAALGLIAIRVASRVVRSRSRRPARSLAGVLIVRPLARVSSALQRNVAVAIVVALAVFATQLAVLSLYNQTRRAEGVVGADRVLFATVPSGLNLRDTVRRADPGGTYAMAAVERRSAADGGTSRIVGVDTTRMAAVMKWYPSWGSGLSAAEVARQLHPVRPAVITIIGRTVHVQLSDVTLKSIDPNGDPATVPMPGLGMTLSTGRAWINVALGPLRAGAPAFDAMLVKNNQDEPVETCQSGCRFVHFYLYNNLIQGAGPYSAGFTVASMSTDRQPATTLAPVLQDSSRWQPWATKVDSAGSGVKADPVGTARGLKITVVDPTASATPGVSATDAPDPLPVVIATGVAAEPVLGSPGVRVGAGLDAQRQDIRPIGRPAFLPRTLRDGVLADLDDVSALTDPYIVRSAIQNEVWLRNGAPAAVTDALKKAGIVITATETIKAEQHSLSLAATARAATANLVLIAVAGLIGIAVILATQLIDADRRRTLWTVAQSSRISRARMTRLVLVEIAGPALLGAVIGAATGALAIWLAGLRLPLFTPGSVGPPLDVSLRWALAGVTLAGAVVAILVVSVILSTVEATRDRSRT